MYLDLQTIDILYSALVPYNAVYIGSQYFGYFKLFKKEIDEHKLNFCK